MAHGASCHCMMCTVGKKMGMISDKTNKDHDNHKRNICKSCGSKSEGEPGTCCGAERKPETKKCEGCDHEHKSDGTCKCGCK